jgi:AraC-like DNA-binding protein
MRQPSVAAGLIVGLLDLAARRGADRQALMDAAGLDPATLRDPDARLPFARYVELMRTAEAATGDEGLALRFGAEIGMAEISILGLIMEASPTMGVAFEQMQRYGRLASDAAPSAAARFALEVADGRLYLVDRRQDPNAFPELTEETFAWLTCGPRRFLPQPHVLSVHVTHAAPNHASEYERVFRCPIHFGAHWNALELHPEVAAWPVAQYPRYVFGVLCERADALTARQAPESEIRTRLRSLLLDVLHQGDIGVDDAAPRLGCSRSTLFRRLREEGTSFSAVLDDLRREMAVGYLKGQRTSVNETAYLVGFSDPAAFSRAFKRWTGLSPGRFRDTVSS